MPRWLLCVAWVAGCASQPEREEPVAPRPTELAASRAEAPPSPTAPPRGGPAATQIERSPQASPTAGCEEAARLLEAGRSLVDRGDVDEGRKQWVALLRDHPKCPEVPHAYLSLAEHLFGQGDPKGAAELYDRVALFADSGLRPYALYKRAWCSIDLGDHQGALERFVSVIRIADTDPTYANLAEQALRDTVIAFVEVGNPAKATHFYKTIAGPDRARAAIDRLVEQYRMRGDEAAIERVCGKDQCLPPRRIP